MYKDNTLTENKTRYVNTQWQLEALLHVVK